MYNYKYYDQLKTKNRWQSVDINHLVKNLELFLAQIYTLCSLFFVNFLNFGTFFALIMVSKNKVNHHNVNFF